MVLVHTKLAMYYKLKILPTAFLFWKMASSSNDAVREHYAHYSLYCQLIAINKTYVVPFNNSDILYGLLALQFRARGDGDTGAVYVRSYCGSAFRSQCQVCYLNKMCLKLDPEAQKTNLTCSCVFRPAVRWCWQQTCWVWKGSKM